MPAFPSSRLNAVRRATRRPDFEYPRIVDELKYAVRGDLWQPLARETVTVRHNLDEAAAPYRKYGSFVLGNGVGGAGVHWNGQLWRASPEDLRLRSHIEERYGKSFIPDDMTIQDYPVTFEELEPHFDHFEKVCGVSGDRRKSSRSNPPRRQSVRGPTKRRVSDAAIAADLRCRAVREGHGGAWLQVVSACRRRIVRLPITNPYGVRLGPCNLCGFCERFGCFLYSKASPQTTILPILADRPNLEVRTNAYVTRILRDNTGKRATGVLYIDEDGREVEQPADIVVLSAFQMHNVRLLLLSGIGVPYDPVSGEGIVGKNYAYQMCSADGRVFQRRCRDQSVHRRRRRRTAHHRRIQFRPFRPRTGHGFIGGSSIYAGATGGRPIEQMMIPPDTPKWGKEWKTAIRKHYRHSAPIGTQGSVMSYRDRYLSLDPTYKDAHGLPLLRLTFDWHDNEYKMAAFSAARVEEIVRAMKPEQQATLLMRPGDHYDVRIYQTTHTTGGAIIGTNPSNSFINRYSQSWDVSNLFVMGASAFPQNIGYNPTGLLAGLAYFSAAKIRDTYLKSPGPLVPA